MRTLSLRPETRLRHHRLHLQFTYDYSVMAVGHAELVDGNGRPLRGPGSAHHHRISPQDWWQITPHHLAHRVATAHHEALSLHLPEELGAVPLHLHPEGEHAQIYRHKPTLAPQVLHPSTRLALRDTVVIWRYEGDLKISTTHVARDAQGSARPEFTDTHHHYIDIAQWWGQPLRHLVRQAIGAHYAHLGLDNPPLETIHGHLHPDVHPYGAHVMPGGPTDHPSIPNLDYATVHAHLMRAKDAEYWGRLAPHLEHTPSLAHEHPLHGRITQTP